MILNASSKIISKIFYCKALLFLFPKKQLAN
jgi:hypothetical protein